MLTNTTSTEPAHVSDTVWRFRELVVEEIPLNLHLVVGKRAAALIDSGLAQSAPSLEALWSSSGVGPRSVRYLINTHAHHDHIGSNSFVVGATGATVLAPPGAVPWIEDHELHYREFVLHHPDLIPDSPELRQEIMPTLDGPVAVDVQIGEGTIVNLGGGVLLEVFDLPGHLHAEIGVYEHATGTLILADAVTGLSSWPLFHGHVSVAQYRATLAKLDRLVRHLQPELIVLAHYREQSRESFLELLRSAEQYLDQIDATIVEEVLSAGAGGAFLRDVWRELCARFGMVEEFRGLLMIESHLHELVARRLVRRIGPDVFAPAPGAPDWMGQQRKPLVPTT